MYVIHTVSTIYKLCLCLYKLVVCFFISQIEMVLSVEQQVYLSKRLRRWFDDWFDTKQEIKIRKSISWWQSVSHSLWGVQLYMLSENIDKFLESLVSMFLHSVPVLINPVYLNVNCLKDPRRAKQGRINF